MIIFCDIDDVKCASATLQVNKEVFVSQVYPQIESELSHGWQHCDQNTFLVVLAATKRKLVCIYYLSVSVLVSVFVASAHGSLRKVVVLFYYYVCLDSFSQ